jgi:hypothetical protein
MHDNEHYNSQQTPEKKAYELWPKAYFAPCPTRTINGKDYSESQMYTQTEGFIPVSEYTVIRQNMDGNLWDSYVKHFRAYKIDNLKTYKANSYSKSYTKWHDLACVRKNTDGTETQVTPNVVEEMLDGPLASVL